MRGLKFANFYFSWKIEKLKNEEGGAIGGPIQIELRYENYYYKSSITCSWGVPLGVKVYVCIKVYSGMSCTDRGVCALGVRGVMADYY